MSYPIKLIGRKFHTDKNTLLYKASGSGRNQQLLDMKTNTHEKQKALKCIITFKSDSQFGVVIKESRLEAKRL